MFLNVDKWAKVALYIHVNEYFYNELCEEIIFLLQPQRCILYKELTIPCSTSKNTVQGSSSKSKNIVHCWAQTYGDLSVAAVVERFDAQAAIIIKSQDLSGIGMSESLSHLLFCAQYAEGSSLLSIIESKETHLVFRNAMGAVQAMLQSRGYHQMRAHLLHLIEMIVFDIGDAKAKDSMFESGSEDMVC